jgi:hypothetical protein
MKLIKLYSIAAACLLGIGILTSLLGVLGYAVLLQLISIPFITIESQMVLAAIIDFLQALVRIVTSAFVGWLLYVRIYKQATIQWKGVLIRYFKHNWAITVLCIIFLWSLFDTSSITFKISNSISEVIESSFSTYSVLSPDQVAYHGVEFNFPATFFLYLLLNPVGYISLVMAFFSYRFRNTLSNPDMKRALSTNMTKE